MSIMRAKLAAKNLVSVGLGPPCASHNSIIAATSRKHGWSITVGQWLKHPVLTNVTTSYHHFSPSDLMAVDVLYGGLGRIPADT